MGLVERFFGRGEDAPGDPGPVANPALENPLSLQLLFPEESDVATLDARRLTETLRSVHPDLAEAVFEVDAELAAKGTPLGLAGWGNHVVKLVGFNVPMPPEVIERCVAPAHYGPELKAQARAHKAHALLFYAGYEEDALEQYVALAVVAGALAAHGAIVVLNESAHTSFPARVLAPGELEGDLLEHLRTLPLPVLYCGFVKYDVEGVKGVWMRTYGTHLLGLPDLAFRASGHDQGEWVFNLFGNILDYLRRSGARFGVGHTMQVGSDTFLRLRAPTEKEYFLDSEGELFVAELISADEISKP
jgi:hypothetical protein